MSAVLLLVLLFRGVSRPSDRGRLLDFSNGSGEGVTAVVGSMIPNLDGDSVV